MKSISSYLKIRAVRLGIMAAFVISFIGLPSYGYANDVAAFTKLDVFGLNETILGYNVPVIPSGAIVGGENTVNSLENFFSSVFSF